MCNSETERALDLKSEDLSRNPDVPTYFTTCGMLYTLLKLSKPLFLYLQDLQ